jgi:hypothetical protein
MDVVHGPPLHMRTQDRERCNVKAVHQAVSLHTALPCQLLYSSTGNLTGTGNSSNCIATSCIQSIDAHRKNDTYIEYWNVLT